jgi:hypothetical protein
MNLSDPKTYPNEYNTEQEAEEAAAKLACENLGIGTSGSLPFGPGVATSPTPSQMHTVTSDRYDKNLTAQIPLSIFHSLFQH